MEDTSQTVPLLVAATAFLVLVLLFLGVLQYFRQRSTKLQRMARVRRSDEYEQMPSQREMAAGADTDAPRGVLKFLGLVGKRVQPRKQSDISLLRKKFLTAGMRGEHIVPVFWGTKCLLVLLLPGALVLSGLLFNRPIKSNIDLAVCLFLALAGFYVPDLWLQMKAGRRKERIFRGLPDALDLLVICVEAGMGLDAAIRRVGEEIGLSHKELSDELRLFGLELRAGKPRSEALKNLADRIDLEDMKNFSSLMIQTDRFGTSVGDALRVYSDTFRKRRFSRAEEIAAKLPGKLMFPLILFIFPALFVAILGPAAIRFYEVISKS